MNYIMNMNPLDLVWNISLVAGIYLIGSFVWMIIKTYFTYRKECGVNLSGRYGEDTWALVTGASKGLGLSFCHELARHGFNIIMAARTASLMEESADIIRTRYKVKVKVLPVDLSLVSSSDTIIKETEGYDVSVLVSNAGVMYPNAFADATLTEISNTIEVNLRTPIKLVSHFANRMEQRKGKSAIVVTSSMTADIPFPYLGLYTPTKAFLSEYFNKVHEGRENIDFLISEYGAVSTDMVPLPIIPGIISDSDETVRCTLKALGRRLKTYGCFMHNIQKWFLSMEICKYFLIIMGWLAATKPIKMLLENRRKLKHN